MKGIRLNFKSAAMEIESGGKKVPMSCVGIQSYETGGGVGSPSVRMHAARTGFSALGSSAFAEVRETFVSSPIS